MKLKNEPYFKALPVWKYAADPAYQEVFLRRCMRNLFGHKNKVLRHVSDYSTQAQQPETLDPAPVEIQEPINQEPEMTSENVIPFPDNTQSENRR